jgi:DNA-binding GntR family transcriptional regulator
MPEGARYRTATEYAVAAIKEWILVGDLAPGLRLDQFELAERLGMSRIPIRTALERLSSEGLVDLLPHRGAVVAGTSRQEMLDLYSVRNHLEGLATHLAAARITDEQLDRLEQNLRDTERQVKAGDLEAFLRTNREFHMAIYSAAGNDVLVRVIKGLWDLSERYRRAYLQHPARAEESTAEHRRLLGLLRERNGDAAAVFVREHNEKTIRTLAESYASGRDG